MTQNPLGVALIGAGMIAKTHVKALSGARDVAQLKAIVSRHPDRARPLAEHYVGEAPTFTANLSTITADPAIQMVIVATPPSVRHSIIEPLAKAGKHILLEKPIGRTLQETEEIIDICERAGVTLGIVFQHRMRAPSVAATDLIAMGALGQLGLVEISVPIWRDQSYYDELGRGTYARDGGGVMLTNAIHSIDLALSLTGPVTRVQAMTATTSLHRMEAEDFAIAGLQFACGASGSFVASTAMYPHRTEVIRLHFERASLRIDKDTLTVDWRDGRQEVAAAGTPTKGKHEWHQAVIENFIHAVQTGNKPIVTGHDALISHRLIESMERSSRTSRAVDISVHS